MIELKHISKSFGQQQILKDISLLIPEGSRTCIVGRSGIGKSVLLRLILGLETPDEGEILIDRQSTQGYSRPDWNALMRDFGVVFQTPALFDSLNILQNVGLRFFEEKTYSDQEIEAAVIQALEKVHLGPEVLPKLPNQLSGGMQKRVGIARAILHRPKYLIYDEPTTGLDPVSAGAIDELIYELSEEPGRTSLLVTHDLHTVTQIATQVVMIHKRQAWFNGSSEDFFGSELEEVKAFLGRGSSQEDQV